MKSTIMKYRPSILQKMLITGAVIGVLVLLVVVYVNLNNIGLPEGLSLSANNYALLNPDMREQSGPIKVGEIEPLSLTLEYRNEGDLQKTVNYPDASYIKVHISSLDLFPGDTITVSDPSGTHSYTYPGSPYTIESGDVNGFWAISIPGDTAVIQLNPSKSDDISIPPSAREYYQKALDGAEINDLEIVIDKFARGYPESDIQELFYGVDSTCGSNQRTDVVCYEDSHPVEFEESHAVARLLISNQYLCTGWRASEQNRVFTNEHCITSQADVSGTEVRFNYQRTACGSGSLAAQTVVTGDTLLTDSYNYDMALFTVNDFETIASFGYLDLDVRTPVLDEEIYIPQHGGGDPKQFGIESDLNTGNVCRIDDAIVNGITTNSDTGYYCDTTGGSSGSPVLARSSNGVIALHHFGISGSTCTSTDMNQGVRIDLIWPLVEGYFDTPDVGPLVYDSHTIDDDLTGDSSGNGDGIANCGENIELFVDLFNQGGDGATGVEASISTGDPYVSWLQNTSSSYPDIASSASASNSDDFDFALSPDTPDGHTITFELEASASNGGAWNDTFNLPVTCAAAPAPPTNLTATSISGTQIDLSWTDNASDESAFLIERSPDGNSGWTEIDTVSANMTSYSNSGLDCDTTYHYRVRAYRSGDGQYSDYSNVDNAQTYDCRTLSLVAGWNLITLPLQPVSPYDAQSLLDDINGQGGTCTEVDRWLSGTWDAFEDGLDFNDFDIFPAEGYFIKCTSNSDWILEGSPISAGIPLDLAAGWNLVGIPYPETGYTAQSLLDDINSQGAACSEADRWSSGTWDAHGDGIPVNNFAILPEEGYFIKCSLGGDFSP